MMTRTAFTLLKCIGASEPTFVIVGAEIEKAALGVMQKLLKAKELKLSGLHDVCKAVGTDSFAAVIDNLADKDITSVVKKFDKLWPGLKSASMSSQRGHVLALATGQVEPVVKAAPIPKAIKSKKAEPVAAAWSQAMSAKPPGSPTSR
jgi:hypothetical protein